MHWMQYKSDVRKSVIFLKLVIEYLRIFVIMILNVFPTIPIEDFLQIVKISKDSP